MIHTGIRYRLRNTEREGMVIQAGEQESQWAEMRRDWPFPSHPINVPNDQLVRVQMRDKRGEAAGLPEALF